MLVVLPSALSSLFSALSSPGVQYTLVWRVSAYTDGAYSW